MAPYLRRDSGTYKLPRGHQFLFFWSVLALFSFGRVLGSIDICYKRRLSYLLLQPFLEAGSSTAFTFSLSTAAGFNIPSGFSLTSASMWMISASTAFCASSDLSVPEFKSAPRFSSTRSPMTYDQLLPCVFTRGSCASDHIVTSCLHVSKCLLLVPRPCPFFVQRVLQLLNRQGDLFVAQPKYVGTESEIRVGTGLACFRSSVSTKRCLHSPAGV